MNKPVSLELKQLLYNKGWRYELSDDISEIGSLYNNHSLAEERFNQNDVNYVDITIADIIMWLFNEHDIWISVKPDAVDTILKKTLTWEYEVYDNTSYIEAYNQYAHSSIQEAYIEAIKYCLNNKINK